MIDVRRAADRFRTVAEGRETFHSFSFGDHYDPGNVGFGLLVAYNDERLPAGGGYADHPHRETEIVTVLLSGSLRHDSDVGRAVLRPGDVQRLTAGTGVRHAERAAGADGARFVQAWLRPRRAGLVPAYRLERGALRAIEGGPLPSLAAGDGTLHLGRVPAGAEVPLPRSPRLHVHAAQGRGRLGSSAAAGATALGEDDVARARDEDGLTLLAETDLTVLVWDVAEVAAPPEG